MLGGLEYNVEIVIVDGMSSDNTKEIVMDLKSNYLKMNYIQMTKAEGFDKELDLGVVSSKGTFVWVFSDDDIITGKNINEVVKVLQSDNKLDLLLVNAAIWDKELNTCLKNTFIEHPECESTDVDELFEKFVDYMSFIGGCILRKEYWLNADATRYFGTLFVHVGIIFSSNEVRWKWINEPMIKIRYGNASWSSKAQNIWMRKWPDLLMSFDSVSLPIRRNKVSFGAISIFKKLVFFKAINCYDENMDLDIEYIKNKVFAKVLMRLVTIMPQRFCFILSYVSASLQNKETMLYDLKISSK
ncbi:hypothetical protein KACHI17_12470 [Sediminibacterium sp. KACHI17]|uniref:Glycosyltransferase 2-like domain-containing protein n=2 Tax=Sediminibacterium sp. KACHI17 TaxID=1751071 RepID=A0AAT9GIF8_9BACT